MSEKISSSYIQQQCENELMSILTGAFSLPNTELLYGNTLTMSERRVVIVKA